MRDAVKPAGERCLPGPARMDRFQHPHENLPGQVLCQLDLPDAAVDIGVDSADVLIVKSGECCGVASAGPKEQRLLLRRHWARSVIVIGCLLYTSPSPRD